MISSSFVVRVATAAVLPALTFDGAVATADADGALSVDGQTMSAGDLMLVKDQVDKAQNGIFNVVDAGGLNDPFVIERYAPALGLKLGNIVFVKEGDVNTSRLFVVVEVIEMVGSDDTCVDFAMSTLVVGKITEAVENEGVDICVGTFGLGTDTGGLKLNGKRVLLPRLASIVDYPVPNAANNPGVLNDAVTKTDFNLLVDAVNELYDNLRANAGSGHGLFEDV